MLKTLQISTIMTLAALNKVLAQTSPAAPNASTSADGGANWLWIILVVAIVAAAAWYFLRGRSRTTTTSATGTSAASGTTTSRTNVYDHKKRP